MTKGSVTKKEIAKLARMHGAEEDKIHEHLKKKEKFFKIDREIRLLMKKGAINEQKTAWLAKRYAIGEDKLRKWIKEKEEETNSELDKCVRICTEKGYVTEEEVARLARLFATDEASILVRAKCPIKKESISNLPKPQPLDNTLEKLISDHLNIIGKSSLYDFLDVSPEAGLQILQDRAREKEMEIRKIGQKDAVITASGALAGHCIVIFNSKESRKAYDISRSRSFISELSTDINAAGTEGKIRAENFDILVKSAIKTGMDLDEAYEYVREYCRNEKWVIKEKKKWLIIDKKKLTLLEKWSFDLNPRKKSFWILVGAVFATIFIVISSVVISGHIIQANRLKNAYQKTLTSLESQQTLENKEKILQDFVSRYGETEYAAGFQNKIREIRKQMEDRDFEITVGKVEKLHADKNFEEAKILYHGFLKKYPGNIHEKEIRQRISDIPGLIDDRDYEKVREVAEGDYAERIKIYNKYFEKHPRGRHIDEIKKLISDMIGDYYDGLGKELTLCEKQYDWEKCIRLCDEFIEKFGGTEQSERTEGLRITYQKRIKYKNDLAEMKHQTESSGTDFEGAKYIYSEYLVANPEAPSYVKDLVTKEIAELDRKAEQYRKDDEEWDYLFTYGDDTRETLASRVEKFEKYVKKPPPARYAQDASSILKELKRKKALEDEGTREHREKTEWVKIARYSQNFQVRLGDRIHALEKYIKENSSGKYINDAKAVFNKLNEEKISEEERVRKQKEAVTRRRNEIKQIETLVRKTGGRFVANKNATVTDTRTGLMWCAIDSLADLGGCTDYDNAVRYVENLKTGGYTDWRIPTANELAGIYKNPPFFPASSAKWFWTSDIIWHGWNKKAHIVTSERETAWNKEPADLSKCGSVRAVRK